MARRRANLPAFKSAKVVMDVRVREAFTVTKQLLIKSEVLTFSAIQKPIALICDPSSYGHGAAF